MNPLLYPLSASCWLFRAQQLYRSIELPISLPQGQTHLWGVVEITEHGETCGKPNRLAGERSPYLKIHSCDPVDWHRWEDVEKGAVPRDKPLFVSIGYSTCHWCHVMHRESFQNDEVARVINEVFTPVKVDREERPDVDEYYMSYCMSARASCGWPLTVLALPDGRPFWIATYLRPDDLVGLARAVREAWLRERDEIEAIAGQAASMLEKLYTPAEGKTVDREVFKRAYRSLYEAFDPAYGGFGVRPKFPESAKLLFLLSYGARCGSREPMDMVWETVSRMISGGIHDKVWGGFHRYAIDRDWRTPHFEKMLYDQGSLARVLGELWLAGYRSPVIPWTARKLVSFLEEFMIVEGGGLAAALDAESGGLEGGFYTWTLDELESALGEDLKLATRLFGFKPEGNYIEEAGGSPSGRNILHMPLPVEMMAEAFAIGVEELLKILDSIASRMRSYAADTGRDRPARDDKVLAGWNGIAIWGLSRLGYVDSEAVGLAERVSRFVEKNHLDGDRLYRVWLGEPYQEGFLEDYSLLALGLLSLHEATGKERYIELSYQLASKIPELFQGDGGELRVRKGGPMELFDGQYPSGYSAALEVMFKLARLLDDRAMQRAAEKALKAISGLIAREPVRYAYGLVSLDFALNPSYEIVVALPREDGGLVEHVVEALSSTYAPASIIYWRPKKSKLSERASHLRSLEVLDGETTIYVCTRGTCSLPTKDVGQAMKFIASGYAIRCGE